MAAEPSHAADAASEQRCGLSGVGLSRIVAGVWLHAEGPSYTMCMALADGYLCWASGLVASPRAPGCQ